MNWRYKALLLIALSVFLMNTYVVSASAESSMELLVIECDAAGGLIELEYENECAAIEYDYEEWMFDGKERCLLRVISCCDGMIAKVTVNGEEVVLENNCYEFDCEGGLTKITVSFEAAEEENAGENEIAKADAQLSVALVMDEEIECLKEEKVISGKGTEEENKVSAISYDATVTYLNTNGTLTETPGVNEGASEALELDTASEAVRAAIAETKSGGRLMENVSVEAAPDSSEPETEIISLPETAALNNGDVIVEADAVSENERISYAADSEDEDSETVTENSATKIYETNGTITRSKTKSIFSAEKAVGNTAKAKKYSGMLSVNLLLYLILVCCMIITEIFVGFNREG